MQKIDIITIVFEAGFVTFLGYINFWAGIVMLGLLIVAHIIPETAHDHDDEQGVIMTSHE